MRFAEALPKGLVTPPAFANLAKFGEDIEV
jgi:hypothetical protein